MNYIRTAIIEDTKADAERLSQFLIKYEEEKPELKFVVSYFPSSFSFLDSFTKAQYDLLFIDINLGDENGMSLAQEIRKTDQSVIIVFETELEKYAAKGYEVDALDFMVKPLTYPSFALRMDKVIRILGRNSHEAVLLSIPHAYEKVFIRDICYIEVRGHYLQYHLIDGRSLEVKGSLGNIEKKLKTFNFMKCNNCYLVNPIYIKSIENFDCVLSGVRLQISHPRKKAFVKEFMDYLLDKKKETIE